MYKVLIFGKYGDYVYAHQVFKGCEIEIIGFVNQPLPDLQKYAFDYILIPDDPNIALPLVNQKIAVLKILGVKSHQILPQSTMFQSHGYDNLLSILNLHNFNFSIISDDCWGGMVYQEFGLPYTTPFVGMWIVKPDYLRMLKNLQYYLNCNLTFKKYPNINYPVGFLDDVEIHFNHYENKPEEYVQELWQRRLSRFNQKNMVIKFCVHDEISIQNGGKDNIYLLKEFSTINLDNKVCFTKEDYSHIGNFIWLKELTNKELWQSHIENQYSISRKYFNIVDWLNSMGSHCRSFCVNCVNHKK